MTATHNHRQTSLRKLWSWETLFALVGGVIVLGSFVIKDVEQDDIREKIGTLQRALDTFEAQNRLADLMDSVDALAVNVKAPISEQDRQLGFDRNSAREDYYDGYIGRVNSVYESIPSRWQADTPARDILERKERLQDLANDYRKKLDELSAQTTDQQVGDKQNILDSHEKITAWAVSQEAAFVRIRVLQEIENKRHSLEIWSIAGYIAFAAGWILAILGKLFHVPGLAAE